MIDSFKGGMVTDWRQDKNLNRLIEDFGHVFPPDLISRLSRHSLPIPGLHWRQWWVGVLVAVGLAGFFLACDLLLRPPQATSFFADESEIWDLLFEESILAGLIAYIITTHNITRHAFMMNIIDLRPSLSIDDDTLHKVAWDFVAQRGRGQVIAVCVGLVIGLPAAIPVFADLGGSPVLVAAIIAKVAIVFALVAFATFDAWIAQRFLVKLTRLGLKINLLDLSPIEPIGRFGLQVAMAIVVGCALSVPLMTDENAFLVAGGFILFGLILAVMALLLPARGANEVIKNVKKEELKKVNSQIETAWKNARHRDDDRALKARMGLPGLIAYRREIEQAREWPFGSSTLLRFVLLAFLPIGSWIGAAIAEQLIDFVM